MGRYISNAHPEAESLFERLIGYPFAKALYTEVHTFSKSTGNQIRLRFEPIEVVKAEGYLQYPAMKLEQWTDIPTQHICCMGRVLDIPPSIFQIPYAQVRVQYYAGAEEIPDAIASAVQEISDLMHNDKANSWNVPLSHATLLTINKYKKR